MTDVADLTPKLRIVVDALVEAQAEIERLRALVAKYEALAAIALGTLEPPPEDTVQ